jgi:pyrrolidone-carboxylate peptidase
VLLPVAMSEAGTALGAAIDETAPSLILSLGVWPGEAMIRLERRANNFVNQPAGPDQMPHHKANARRCRQLQPEMTPPHPHRLRKLSHSGR